MQVDVVVIKIANVLRSAAIFDFSFAQSLKKALEILTESGISPETFLLNVGSFGEKDIYMTPFKLLMKELIRQKVLSNETVASITLKSDEFMKCRRNAQRTYSVNVKQLYNLAGLLPKHCIICDTFSRITTVPNRHAWATVTHHCKRGGCQYGIMVLNDPTIHPEVLAVFYNTRKKHKYEAKLRLDSDERIKIGLAAAKETSYSVYLKQHETTGPKLTLTQIQKMKSDVTKIKDPTIAKLVQDIQQYENVSRPVGGPYIRSIGFDPFTCAFFEDSQIDFMKSRTDDDTTCFVDFTGETFPLSSKRSKEKTKRALQLSISYEGAISLGDFLTEKGTTLEIKKFLETWKTALKNKKCQVPKTFVTDFSWPILQVIGYF